MILVTGANGLVGSHLITTLLAQGKQVKALYHYNCGTISHPNLTWQQGDILDVIDLEEIFTGITQVYHCAAIVSFNPKEKQILYKTNVEGTANVVNSCLNTGVEKLLFVSSVASIGRAQINEPIHEAIRWIESGNNSEYSKSKYLSEMEVWRGIGEGLNAELLTLALFLVAAIGPKAQLLFLKMLTTNLHGIQRVLMAL